MLARLRRLRPLHVVLTIIVAASTVGAFIAGVGGAGVESDLYWLLLSPAGLMSGLLTLEIAWTGDRDRWIHRWMARGFGGTAPALLIATLVNPVAAAAMWPIVERGAAMSELTPSGFFLQQLLVAPLVGWIWSLVAMLLVGVLGLVPLIILRAPRSYAKGELLEHETDRDIALARSAGLAQWGLIVVVVASASTITFGGEEAVGRTVLDRIVNAGQFALDPSWFAGDLVFTLGLLLIPIGIWLLIRLSRLRRPDRGVRRARGLPLGLHRSSNEAEQPGSIR